MIAKRRSIIDQQPIDEPPMSTSPPKSEPAIPNKDVLDKDGLDYKQRMRKQLIDEIVSTEKDYVQDLAIVQRTFYQPLRALKIVTQDNLSSIFSNLEMILNVNKIMCEEMSKQLTPEDPHRFNVKIGEAFSTLSPYLKIYSSYCSNQQKAFKTLETLRKTNQEFDQFLEDKMVDQNCRGLLFTSFLIKPVQRICKYPLFIKDLLKYTPEDHEDFQLLKMADAKVNEVVLAVNEYKRSVESLQHVLELASTIEGIDDLVSPGRKYILEFDANIAKPPKTDSQKTRHVFLFNDLLLICKQKTQKKKVTYTIKGKVPFTEVTKLIYLDADTCIIFQPALRMGEIFSKDGCTNG